MASQRPESSQDPAWMEVLIPGVIMLGTALILAYPLGWHFSPDEWPTNAKFATGMFCGAPVGALIIMIARLVFGKNDNTLT